MCSAIQPSSRAMLEGDNAARNTFFPSKAVAAISLSRRTRFSRYLGEKWTMYFFFICMATVHPAPPAASGAPTECMHGHDALVVFIDLSP